MQTLLQKTFNPFLYNEYEILKPVEVELDDTWGLDHGAWSVIKHLYPAANVPVIQLSIDYTKPPEYHFELAKQLHEAICKTVIKDHCYKI